MDTPRSSGHCNPAPATMVFDLLFHCHLKLCRDRDHSKKYISPQTLQCTQLRPRGEEERTNNTCQLRAAPLGGKPSEAMAMGTKEKRRDSRCFITFIFCPRSPLLSSPGHVGVEKTPPRAFGGVTGGSGPRGGRQERGCRSCVEDSARDQGKSGPPS